MVSERIQRHIDRLLNDADEALARFDWGAVASAPRPFFDSTLPTSTLSVSCVQPTMTLAPVMSLNQPLMCPVQANLRAISLLQSQMGAIRWRNSLAKAERRWSISREAQAMGRLGSHPHSPPLF